MVSLAWVLKARQQGIDSVEKLSVLLCIDEPKTYAQVSNEAGVSLRMVGRFVNDSNGLLKVIKRHETRGYMEGRPAIISIVRTAKAIRLLAKMT